MADLSHWDFAEHFSGYDAAALILGIEPRESEHEQWRIRVVADRMELHYEYARQRFFLEIVKPEGAHIDTEAARPVELMSVKMENLHRDSWLYGIEAPFLEWLKNERGTKFEYQEFSRESIGNWLRAIGMKSAYQFRRGPPVAIQTATGRWPWGDHHTDLLGHLEAAANRFWTGYDPSDTTTANTNATVSEWLQKERKVSKTMAEAIASILRPDGLPTGPRK
jgi:hypothetical protein